VDTSIYIAVMAKQALGWKVLCTGFRSCFRMQLHRLVRPHSLSGFPRSLTPLGLLLELPSSWSLLTRSGGRFLGVWPWHSSHYMLCLGTLTHHPHTAEDPRSGLWPIPGSQTPDSLIQSVTGQFLLALPQASQKHQPPN
jgi:hypothetical protein